ncbi:hypothetical protein [Pinibacter soli]|uniref:Outer membrane protein beta-barrel domain-containing protein n=1 Tax=Pinibacter soli TaxID=3044211 RepID=A0ABT6R711_9BACT|nr:hypothetical protein [Pinibacter soli]MDI3318349.1 hypothetical protein [Pinibacter soli]
MNFRRIRTAVLMLSLFASRDCNAQSGSKYGMPLKQDVFFGCLGHNRGIISVNYERKIYASKPQTFFYNLSTGVGYTPGGKSYDKQIPGSCYVPLTMYCLVGKKASFAQIGIGYTAAFGPDFVDSTGAPPVIHKKFESAYTLSLGYRYMNKYGTIIQGYPLLQWTDNPSNEFSIGFGIFLGFAF